MSARPNDPAYPVTDYTGDYPITEPGLTKREYFAVLLMQAHAASPGGDCMTAADAAMFAVVWADALIAALNEEPAP